MNGVRRWTEPAVDTLSVTGPDGVAPNSRGEIQLTLNIGTLRSEGQLFQLNSVHGTAGLSVYLENGTQLELYMEYTNSKNWTTLKVGEGGIVNLTITIQTDQATTTLTDSLSGIEMKFPSPEPNIFQLQVGNRHTVKTAEYSAEKQPTKVIERNVQIIN